MAKISLAYDVPSDQRIGMSIKPIDGHLMSAKVIGEKLIALSDLLTSNARRESGTKWNAVLLNIETLPSGQIDFELLIAPRATGYKKADLFDPTPPMGK